MRNHALLAVASAVTAIALTACTSGGETAAVRSPDELKGKTIAFVPGVSGDSFYISMECGVREEADKHGLRVDMQAPQQFDPSLQTPIVNAVTAKTPAAVLIAPTDSSAMLGPLLQAKQAGITIGLVDTTLDNSDIAVTSVSTNNEAGGAAAADALAKLIGDKGKVLVIAFKAGASTSDARQKGFQQQIAKHPNVEYLGAQINDNDPAKAASIVSATLAAHPDLKGVFATNQFAAEGTATGLRNANAQGQVQVVGFDAGPVQVEQLERGTVQALIAQKPHDIGVDAVQNVFASLTGGQVQKSVETNVVTVTKENLQTPEMQSALYKSSC
jgi:ribose transport system substrate-binding protein